LPRDRTDASITAPPSRGLPRIAAAALAAAGWALVVAARPTPFFGWAAAYAVVWLALSALAAPAGLRARLRPRAADLLIGVVAALVLYALSRLFLRAFCGPWSDALCAPLHATFARFRSRALLAGAALFLAIAPAEELFWRGVVQPRLVARLGPARAITTGTALAAGLALATGEPFLALAILPTYAAWGALTAWRGSLVPAMLSHALWSLLIAAVAPPV
jgi:membrane protease YdiL (CAAX protease family)